MAPNPNAADRSDLIRPRQVTPGFEVPVVFGDCSRCESAERLKLALGASHMGIWEIDIRTGRLLWTDECYAIAGMDSGTEPTLETFIAAMHPDDQVTLPAAINRAIREHQNFAEEFRLVRGDGRMTWIANRGLARYDNNGRAVRILGTMQDITEARNAADALAASERRFREIAENISEVFWLTDPGKSEIEYLSPAFETIWGMPCEQIYREPVSWLEAIHASDRERVRAALAGQATGDYDETYRVVRPDGTERWIRDRAFPVRDEDGMVTRIAGIAEDVTERHNLESQLRHQQKIETIGELAGGVAHDFNNLLTVIATYTGMLEMTLPEGSESREFIAEIRQAGERGSALTRQLLAFSRKEEMDLRVVDLNVVIASMQKMLARLLGEAVLLSTDLRARQPIRADQGQVVQLLMNLAVNARDAMPQGGPLQVATEDVCVSREDDLRPPGHYVVLSVTDAGMGMPAAVVERVFEPFFTTKASGNGTGLGLAVVSTIVQRTGGFIAVDSHPGLGTSFHISFPAVPVEAQDHPEQHAPTNHQGNETILVVEDEEIVRRAAVRGLSARGYTVHSSANAVEALKYLDDPSITIDLLLTDIVMPIMDGTELAHRFCEKSRGTRVLYSTGYIDGPLDKTGSQVLRKPFTAVELAERVRYALDGRA